MTYAENWKKCLNQKLLSNPVQKSEVNADETIITFCLIFNDIWVGNDLFLGEVYILALSYVSPIIENLNFSVPSCYSHE